MNPRQVLKGTTYLLTRRTTQRMFLLRPSKAVNACIRYCLAAAQRRSGVIVHCAVFLSNHYHIVATDVNGLIPVFTEELNKLLARSLNCHHGRWENFFSTGHQTSQVVLVSEDDVLAKMVYALANPTKAMLVSHGPDWPGVRLFRKGTYQALKPKFHFRKEEVGGKLPDKLMLTLSPPPIGKSPQLCDDIVQRAASAHEQELRALANGKRKKYLGAQAVKAQSINRSPKTPAPRRRMSPRVACRDTKRRIEALAQLASFVKRYKETREVFINGTLDAVFPAGTYQMARQYGASCEDF